MHFKVMKQKRQISVNKIRLTLISIVAMQFTNLLYLFSSHISFVLSEAELPEHFKDMNFTNTTFVDGIARKAMKRLHDELDGDDDGNVSPSEGATYIHREDFFTSGPSNLPGFATDKDGRITEEEFWESWVRSTVHNWTATEMSDWMTKEVDLPQYAKKFLQFGISGAAMPIFLDREFVALMKLGILPHTHKHKILLKAKEFLMFGPATPKSNLLKDTLLTVSILLALGGLAYALHVRRSAGRTMAEMQHKLDNLQNEMRKLDEEEAWMKNLTPEEEREDSLASQESSLYSESGLQSRMQELLEELSDTRVMLEQAEERLNDQKWSPPSRLIACLKNTHKAEAKLHEAKRVQAQKKVDHAKGQFQKIQKKSSIFTSVQLIHSQQMDSFDLEVQAAKHFLREVQRDNHEYRKRWLELENICNCHFLSTPHLRGSVRRKSPGIKAKPSGIDSLSFKAIGDSETSSLYNSILDDVTDGLSMKDLGMEDSDTESKINMKIQHSCPTLTQYKHHSPGHRRSEPIANSAPVVIVKSSSNPKSPSPIPETEEGLVPRNERGFAEKKSSKSSRRNGLPCVVPTPECTGTVKRHNSPSRTASLGPRDTTFLSLPKRKTLSSHSLPDLTTESKELSSKLCESTNLSPPQNKKVERKSPKKLANISNIFKRKKKV